MRTSDRLSRTIARRAFNAHAIADWARDMATLISDDGWASAFRIAAHGPSHEREPWTVEQANALLAELDRAWSELDDARRGILLAAPALYAECEPAALRRLVAADLVLPEWPRHYYAHATPRGRAMVRRAKEQPSAADELPCNDHELGPTWTEERPADQGPPARAGLSPATQDPADEPGASTSEVPRR